MIYSGALLGYPKLLLALRIGVSYSDWEYYTPRVLFTLLFVLASVLSFAVEVMRGQFFSVFASLPLTRDRSL